MTLNITTLGIMTHFIAIRNATFSMTKLSITILSITIKKSSGQQYDT